MTTVTAYIGIGSNLDDPLQQVQQALVELTNLPGSRCLASSGVYRSQPMGPQDQPDYCNAVARLETTLEAEVLLDQLQAIEQAHGRVRGNERWGPRTLDLDILLYGDEQIDSERLRVPHPGMAQRNFVLYPLYEISPGLVLPGGQMLLDYVVQCPAEGLFRLDD